MTTNPSSLGSGHAGTCTHPPADLIPQLRAGAPSGYALCAACGARVHLDPSSGATPAGAPITGL